MNLKKIIFLFSFLIIVFIIANVQQIFADRDQQMLTAAKAKKGIQALYPGKIQDITLSKKEGNQIYIADLQVQNRGYALEVDAYSGEILHLTQLKTDTSKTSVDIENEENVSFSSGEKQEEESAKNDTPLMVISLDKAKEIALSKIKGKFNSIDLEDKNGSFIYEIEVETNKKEVVDIEINVYTGEVLSISWDD